MKTQQQIQFEKDYTAMKSFLLGRNYKQGLKAISFARQLHDGMRKDGLTPEFHHQIQIAFSILNLRDVVNEELCLCLAFLHDTPEDKNISYMVLKREFGQDIASKACMLDKHQHATEEDCFLVVASDIDCSIVKGADNGNNIQTMHGAFTKEKMQLYMNRTEFQVLPMLKTASNNFPEQSFAYSALRTRLKDQLALYKVIVDNV
jgi:(p)ppGpp synthase/HD superfamily hydrolase